MEDAAATRALLARILESAPFAQSARLRDLLTFLIEQSLEGKGEEIKESVLAAEVFKRDDYDPRTDSLVRVTTSALRTKLAEYFAGPGLHEKTRITIPKGSYQPVFSIANSSQPSRRAWTATAATAIAAAGLTAASTALWYRHASRPKVAVLPFLNLSGDDGLGYFCDGLSEELIDRLAHLPNIDVIARTSSFFYKDKPQDIRLTGRQPGASQIVEGSVRRSGDLLRVTVQMNRTDTGAHLWSRTYELKLNEIFTAQDKIANVVGSELGAKSISVAHAKTLNLDAWDQVLRGRSLLHRNSLEAQTEAMRCFGAAIEIDHSYAVPHAERARAISNLLTTSSLTYDSIATEFRRHAEEAIRLDPALALGYASLSRVLNLEWNWDAAVAASRRAIELAPGSAPLLNNYAIVLADRADRAAIALFQRAQALDPMYFSPSQQLGRAYYLLRDYDAAVKSAGAGITAHRGLVPLWFRNYIPIALAEGARGNHEAAIKAAELGWSLENNRKNIGWIGLAGHAYAKAGHRDKALECLNQLVSMEPKLHVPPIIQARIHIGLMDKDAAFRQIHRGIDEHDYNATWLRADPRSDALRNDSRWEFVMRRIGHV